MISNNTETGFVNIDDRLKIVNVAVPEYVYKYRYWKIDSHKRLLTNQELFLASPGSFEDSMDCNLQEQFPKGKDLYDLFIEDCKKRCPSKNRDERRKYANYWRKHSPLANKEERDKLLEEIKNKRDKTFGVLSLTLRKDNDYLWERYGNHHKGFCVRFDTKKLIQYGKFGGGGFVQYFDRLPVIDFLHDSLDDKLCKNIFSKKREPYSQEEEYRLTKKWDHDVDDQERVVVIPVDCISQIIVGKDASIEDRTEILEIQRNLYPYAEFIQL